MAKLGKLGQIRPPRTLPRPKGNRVLPRRGVPGGNAPHPRPGPTVDMLTNSLMRPALGTQATTKPLANGVLQTGPAGQVPTGSLTPPEGITPTISGTQIPIPAGYQFPGGTTAPSGTGPGKPSPTTPPTTDTNQPPPSSAQQTLTRAQQLRLARLKNRKKLGKDYNAERLAKLKGLKAGGTTAPGGQGPDERTQLRDLPPWLQEYIGMVGMDKTGWGDKDYWGQNNNQGLLTGQLVKLADAAIAQGMSRKDIKDLLSGMAQSGLGNFNGEPGTLGPIQYFLQNPTLLPQVVQTLQEAGLTGKFNEAQWNDAQTALLNAFPEMRNAYYMGILQQQMAGNGLKEGSLWDPRYIAAAQALAGSGGKFGKVADAYLAQVMGAFGGATNYSEFLANNPLPTGIGGIAGLDALAASLGIPNWTPRVPSNGGTGEGPAPGGASDTLPNPVVMPVGTGVQGPGTNVPTGRATPEKPWSTLPGGRGRGEFQAPTPEQMPTAATSGAAQFSGMPAFTGGPTGNPTNTMQTNPNAWQGPTQGWNSPYSGMQYAPPTAPFAAPSFPGGNMDAKAQQLLQNSFAGMPLSGEAEAGRRVLEDQLASTLSQLGYSWEQIGSIMNVLMARLSTEQGYATQAVNDDFAGRGVFQSGGRQEQQFKTATDFERQRQDIAMDAQNQYVGLANEATGAYQNFTQGLMELLLQLASMQASNPSITLPKG